MLILLDLRTEFHGRKSFGMRSSKGRLELFIPKEFARGICASAHSKGLKEVEGAIHEGV